MKTIKENIAAILLALFVLFIMYKSSVIAEKAREEIEQYKLQLDSLQKANDSLSDILLPTEIQLGRYEVAFDIFRERNPKAAEQYQDIISKQTE